MGPIVCGLQRAESPHPRSLGPDSDAQEWLLQNRGKDPPECVMMLLLGWLVHPGHCSVVVIQWLGFSWF